MTRYLHLPQEPFRLACVAAAMFLIAACSGTTDGASPGATHGMAPDRFAGDAVVPGARDGDIRVVRELPPPQGTANGAEQPVAVNDVLTVDLFQVDELDRTVQVDSRGMISLPLIGEVAASGKSARELEKQIRELYGATYLQSPQVSVFIKESFGQRVTVDGEVRKAGIYPTSATSSLIAVLAQAGGLTQVADASKVYVFRDFGNERLVANYDARAIRSGKQGDPRIYGGDVVVVFASSSKIAMRNLREVLGVARSATILVP